MNTLSDPKIGNPADHLFAKVAPYESGWCVICGAGYYAVPLDRDTALTRALDLAAEHHDPAVGILDIHRECVDFVPISERTRMDSPAPTAPAFPCAVCGVKRAACNRRWGSAH